MFCIRRDLLDTGLVEITSGAWGIECGIDPIQTTGLHQPSRSLSVSVNWRDFSSSAESWGSCIQGATWRIFFGEDLIQELIARAHHLSAKLGITDEMYYELRKIFSDYRWGAGFEK